MTKNNHKKIKVAIAGIGNCASSFVQGVNYYTENPDNQGLMYKDIGGYKIADIEFVAAFDIDRRKVGKDLSKAIFAEPNCTKIFSKVPKTNVVVERGPVLDGLSEHMKNIVLVDEKNIPVDIVKTLKESGAEILVSYMPVGSAEASRFYAQSAIDAGVAFVNAIPEFICSDEKWNEKFKLAGIPCAGDDIKSQVGATILHRIISRLIQDRGLSIESTYQLNIGGNTDFNNMTNQERLISKRISKTRAVISILNEEISKIKIGPSDYIPHLLDNKICYINIKGNQFGGVPYELDLKLSVEDSPNSAGVITEAVRALKIARDKGLSGNINSISAYAFKSPEKQVRDDQAKNDFETFIKS